MTEDDFQAQMRKLQRLQARHERKKKMEAAQVCVTKLNCIQLALVPMQEDRGFGSQPRPSRFFVSKDSPYWDEAMNLAQKLIKEECDCIAAEDAEDAA